MAEGAEAVTDSLCCVCHRPEPDAFLCLACTAQLKTWLQELAGHAVDLEEVVVTRRTSRRSERVMVRGKGESPMPFDDDAAAAAWDLHSDLAAIVRDICEQRGIVYPGVDRSAAMAAWMARNVASMALDPAALDTYDIIRHRHGETVKVVDIPTPRILLGPCDAVVDGRVCGLDVRAPEGAKVVRCGCMTTHDVAEFQVRVLRRMRDRLATLPELLVLFRGQVRPNLLAVWRSRGRFEVKGRKGDAELYSIGAVMDMVEQSRVRERSA